MKKFITTLLHIITLGVSYFLMTRNLYKEFVFVADINQDGKIDKSEIKRIVEQIKSGEAEIKIIYKEK